MSLVFNLLMIIHPPPTLLRLVKLKNETCQHLQIKYTNLHGGTYSPRKVLHTFFLKNKYVSNKFFKNFRALFPALGGFCPIFEFPFSRYLPSIFFPPLHLHSTPTGKRWISTPTSPLHQNLLRHPYIIIYIP